MADMNQDLRVTYELVQTKVQDKAAKQSEKSLSKLTFEKLFSSKIFLTSID